MRSRHIRHRHFVPLLALSLPVMSCDGLSTGQLTEDPGAPVLLRILIQDELPRGGRNVATYLLDRAPPIACSDQEPCPAGDKFSHPPCNLATGVCPDPLKPSQTPPSIGTPGTFGGNQIRFVFNKHLDPAIDVATTNMLTGAISGYELADPSIIGLFDAGGKEITSVKFWDPGGSPTLTSDLFVNPYGPALILKPKTAFIPLTTYSVRLKPDQIKDDKGQALAKDGSGAPIAASYEFKTEGFTQAGGASLDLTDSMKNPDGAIDTKDALVIRTNARFDKSTLHVTVKKGGAVVEAVGVPEFGSDPKLCANASESPLQINVFRVMGEDRVEWEEGDYTVSIEATATDNRSAMFSLSPFGDVPYKDVPFRVRKGVDKDGTFFADKFLLPFECAGPKPTDMAVQFADMAMPPMPDMAMSKVDLSVTPDLAAVNPDLASAIDAGAGN